MNFDLTTVGNHWGVLSKRVTWSGLYFQNLSLAVAQRMNYRKSSLVASRSDGEKRWLLGKGDSREEAENRWTWALLGDRPEQS